MIMGAMIKWSIEIKKKQGDVKRNDLERILEDDMDIDNLEFYILNQQKVKTNKYYCMDGDILTLYMFIVLIESTFCIGCCVLC